MGLFYVSGFTIPGQYGGNYQLYYDSATNGGVVNYTGPYVAQNSIDLTQATWNSGAKYTEGTFLKDICSDNPSTTKVSFYVNHNSPFFTKVLTQNSPDCALPPSPTCDLLISSINTTNETQSGANDGTATINASSSASGVQYSLDNATFQSSNQFSNLAPGNYIGYATDANSCQASQPFTILSYNNPVVNFNEGLPVVDLGNGNISKWNAAFNPIIFRYQRKDFQVSTIIQSGSQIKVQMTTTLPYDQYFYALNGMVHVKSSKYDFTAKPVSYDPGNGFTFDLPYYGDDTGGYLNIDLLKKNFYIETEITAGDNPTEPIIITATNSPNRNGLTTADMSPFLQTLLSKEDTFNYLTNSYRDYNLAGSYTLRYREVWDTGSSQWYYAPYPLYYTFAAKQLGEQYGGNMANYVPFLSVPYSQKSLFLTDFEQPTYFKGLPFDLSFIYSENVIDEQLYMELIPDCGNSENSLLLNADAGYILNADQSRFVIKRVYNPNIQGYPIIEALGVNRALMPDVFDCCASEISTNIYYLDGENRRYIMQYLKVKQECNCEDPYVYLKWINSRGGWDYWRFGYNQSRTNTVDNSERYKKFVNDWENDTTIEDFFSRQANKKLTVYSGQLEQQELKALSWMANSIRVQMLVSKNPVKWQTVILNDGDFTESDTKKNKGDVKLQLSLPATNIQFG